MIVKFQKEKSEAAVQTKTKNSLKDPGYDSDDCDTMMNRGKAARALRTRSGSSEKGEDAGNFAAAVAGCWERL